MAKGIHVIGNTVDFINDDIVTQNNNNILTFIGKMSYEPNIIAVWNFTKNVFPIIRKNVDNVTFYIVGANPDKRIQILNNSKDIIVTGYVDDIIEYLHKTTVVVAPMITGAGIQNKIIQAMALGCCVVTTDIGAEGLSIKKGEVSIVEANEKMAYDIVHLLNDIERRKTMGILAKEYVKENLSIEIISQQFNIFINDIR